MSGSGVLESRLISPLEATLGEEPVWVDADAALWFVDIKRGRLHRYDLATNVRRSIDVGGQPSFIAATDARALLIGSGDALRLLNNDLLSDPIATVAMPAHNRTNDAMVDATGRLWLGTMDGEERQPTGAVHVSEGGAIRPVGSACTITNGPAIIPDGRFLYHVDTLARTILRFDILAGDDLVDGETFATIEPDAGNPDGVSFDAAGGILVGLWGGWEARRYEPGGNIDARVAFPCANITKVAFGGEGLRTAYVTTARHGLSDEALADQPLAGALFAFHPPVPGQRVPVVEFGL